MKIMKYVLFGWLNLCIFLIADNEMVVIKAFREESNVPDHLPLWYNLLTLPCWQKKQKV